MGVIIQVSYSPLSLQVYLGEKKQKYGVRFNLNPPSLGEDLQARINVNKQIIQIKYSLLSLPLYLAFYIKRPSARLEQ